jgi:ubiquinone/menaquinone biosynthesis C-methylase UbiE
MLQQANCQSSFKNVADIACGTGHSTIPLLDYSENVYGTDISVEMLNIAKQKSPKPTYYLRPAEDLPFGDGFLDAIFVCMAMHWFDQEKFLSEVRRTLKPEGLLFIYNMRFPGTMLQNPSYNDWHTKQYWARYPNPKRHTTSLDTLLENNAQLKHIANHSIDLSIDLNSIELRNYLLTQSNIDAAIDNGDSLESIERWVGEGIEPFFKSNKAQFIYSCELSIAQRI